MTASVHPGEDRLIDLAARLLAPTVEEDTLRHLETCPPCEGRFRALCRNAELARLRAPHAPKRRLPAWTAAVAASLLLVAVAAGWWIRSGQREDPAAYWFPVDSETGTLRTGTPDPEEEVFRRAVAGYRSHDARQVVALLRDRSIPEVLDPLKIMLASALVKTGEFANADEVLTDLRIETLPQPDRDRASWIRYAALRGAGRDVEARGLARELASRPGEFAASARAELAR